MDMKEKFADHHGKNPSDPLNRPATLATPGRELFKRFSEAADGFDAATVIDAAANTIINAARQTYGTRQAAEARMGELHAKMTELLVSQYDAVTGKRRSIFPHNQVIAPQLFRDKDV